jgi:multiple sugar transport system substrate-binding protein
VDGKQYIGLGLSITHAIRMNSYGLPYVDKKSDKALLDTDKFKKIVDTLVVRPTLANGYKEYIASLKKTFNNNNFMKDKNMAMFVMNYGLQDQKDFATFNWDMYPLPVFADQPKIGSQPYPNILFVTSLSKYKDQAVEVLKFLTSDEYQMITSKKGYITVLKDEKIKKAFAQELGYKDKNVANAVFYNKYASVAPKTEYDNIASRSFNKQVMKLIQGETDLNTALRTAEEETNKGIETEKSK